MNEFVCNNDIFVASLALLAIWQVCYITYLLGFRQHALQLMLEVAKGSTRIMLDKNGAIVIQRKVTKGGSDE